jgi:hypothetical protein
MLFSNVDPEEISRRAIMLSERFGSRIVNPGKP